MPPNLIKVGQAVANGLSAVCATCDRYWEPKTRGVLGDQCGAKDGCCSPLGGGDFHEYVGPISDLSRWCFVCGSDATRGARARGRARVIGVCEDHVKLFLKLRPTDDIDVVGADIVNGKTTVPIERLMNRKKFSQTVLEVDAYLAEQGTKKR